MEANGGGGRDFVVGDVHGEFETLEAMLASLGFPNGRLTLARTDTGPFETLSVATQARRQAPTDIPRAAGGVGGFVKSQLFGEQPS